MLFVIPFVGSALGLFIAVARTLDIGSSLSIGQGQLLSARQTSGPIAVPIQCQSICNPVNTAVGNGCSPAQCCTDQFETQYFNCFLCVGSAINLTDYSQPQQILDSFAAQCASAGSPIPKLTFPSANTTSMVTSMATSTGSITSSGSQSTRSTNVSTVTSVSLPPNTSTRVTITSLSATTTSPSPATTNPSPATTSGPTNPNSALERYHVPWMWTTITGCLIVGWLFV